MADATLHVYRSNRLEVLAGILAELLNHPTLRPPDPFTPVRVVVNSRGMERWLRQQLAMAHDICANVELPFPAQTLERVATAAHGTSTPDNDAWRPDILTWALAETLVDQRNSLRSDPVRFAPLLDHLPHEAHLDRDALAVAEQLAGVFDRYLVYRPDMARAWSESADVDRQGPWAWQAWLWRQLGERLGHAHFAGRVARAADALESAPADLPAPLDQPLRIFGLTALPPAWLQLLEAASQVVPVELFLLCPAPGYWDGFQSRRDAIRSLAHATRDDLPDLLQSPLEGTDAARPHPLLASWGRKARDLQLQLADLAGGFVDEKEFFLDPTDTADHPGALQHLQSDIYTSRWPDADAPAERHTLDPGDDTLQFHACHGDLRQVEVLRDAILHLLHDHPDLEPRDIVVMTPSLDTFAPLISAVFDQGSPFRHDNAHPDLPWGPSGTPQLPYRVAGLSLRRTNPFADALVRTLELASGRTRLSSAAIMELLELEILRDRFGLALDHLPLVREWMATTRAAWGFDAEDRRRSGQPAHPGNTLRYALDRLLAGVTSADNGTLFFREDTVPLAPFDGMEGEPTQILGRFADFVTTLAHELDRLREPRDATGWFDALLGVPDADDPAVREGTLGRLTRSADGSTWLEHRVRSLLTDLRRDAALAQSTAGLTVDALRATLDGRFAVSSDIAPQVHGGISISDLQPFHSVPFKVVCLLGMDSDAFPRGQTPPRFNRMAEQPLPGDPDPKDDDRFLLLEALLAARNHLIVVYSGRDPITNDPLEPAVPIGELRDAVRHSFEPVEDTPADDALTHHHPLQPFGKAALRPSVPDPLAGQPDPYTGRIRPAHRPWAFDPRLLRGARSRFDGDAVVQPFCTPDTTLPPRRSEDHTGHQLTLNDLRTALYRCAQDFIRSRLQIDWRTWDIELADREPLPPAPAGDFDLDREVLAWQADGVSNDDMVARLSAQGRLPLGTPGARLVASRQAHAETLLDQRDAWDLAPTTTQRLELTFGDVVVRDQIDVSDTTGMVFELYTRDDKSPQSLPWIYLPMWLRTAAWAAQRQQATTGMLLFLQGDKAQVRKLTVEPSAATTWFEHAIDIWRRSREQVVPVFPHSSAALAWNMRKEPPGSWHDSDRAAALTKALGSARTAWTKDLEKQAALQHVWNAPPPVDADSPHFERFVALAEQIWLPIWLARGTAKAKPSSTSPKGGRA